MITFLIAVVYFAAICFTTYCTIRTKRAAANAAWWASRADFLTRLTEESRKGNTETLNEALRRVRQQDIDLMATGVQPYQLVPHVIANLRSTP